MNGTNHRSRCQADFPESWSRLTVNAGNNQKQPIRVHSQAGTARIDARACQATDCAFSSNTSPSSIRVAEETG